MIAVEAYRDRRIGVYGLGRTGVSAVRTLLAGGAEVVCWDDDPGRREVGNTMGALAIAPSVEGWQGVVAVVLSPGIPLTHPEPHLVVRIAEELGAEVIGDIELFARSRPAASIVAITGTNGKSTTTSLISHLLDALGKRCISGGNLGTPVLDFDVLPAYGAYALELSSYQIDLTASLRPTVSVLINISPDHLDRHGGMDGYVAAKYRLFEMGLPESRMVIGVDDEWSMEIADRLEAKEADVTRISVRQSLSDGIFVLDGVLHHAKRGNVSRLRDIRDIETLRGAHNWQNAACAIAALQALGFDPVVAAEFLSGFAGLAHRMEHVATIGDVRFVNDSKATNAEAAAQALAVYDNILWIAGGIQKQGGIQELGEFFPKIAHAFLIGESMDSFASVLETSVAVTMSSTLEQAIHDAVDMAKQLNITRPVILLSPACASFDQFDSFEARGDAFRTMVQKLAVEAAA
jgi:UDP-N-acetylmuramoylalanine--D-glutamate ligase